MKTITIGNKEYTLEYTIKAAYDTELVEKTVLMQTGAYLVEGASNGINAMALGSAKMFSEIPKLCLLYFKAGLLEHHKEDSLKAEDLMATYMVENKLSFTNLYKELQEVMKTDGFFDLIGLTEMMNEQEKEIKKIAKNQKIAKIK